MLVHTHNIYQDQTIMLLIGGNDGSIFFYATTTISTTIGGICGGTSIDFYSDIGGIDQLCSPVSYIVTYACACIHHYVYIIYLILIKRMYSTTYYLLNTAHLLYFLLYTGTMGTYTITVL